MLPADKTVVMSRVRFGVQTLVVLALVAFVSWPDSVRTKESDAPLAHAGRSREQRGERRDRRFAGLQHEIGWGSISLQRTSTAGSGTARRSLFDDRIEGGRRHRTSAGVLALGGRFNGIIGSARTGLNAPVPFARLVLRNPVTGKIEARAVADDNGEFTFLDVEPNAYVVEMLGPEDAVFAASDPVTVNIGELREATVRLPAGREVLAALGTVAPTADQAIRAAATSGVNAVAAPERSISPQR